MKTSDSFWALEKYSRVKQYKGWDLFDGLKSTVFKDSCLYDYRLLRLAWIQFFKRSPINFRKMFKVAQGHNVKGLALFASGYIQMNDLESAEELIQKIISKKIPNADYCCWGYNFDWEARAFYVPEGTPNIVTTVFAAQALLDFYDATNKREYLVLAEEVCCFILTELILHEDQDTVCFGYIPEKKVKVHNANMLGASLLGRVYSLTGNKLLLKKSKKAMKYAMASMRKDFSWVYGEQSHHQWVDNFHTGFNLVALNDWMKYTEDYTWTHELKKAHDYFLENFWLNDGCPKYYNNALYPIDIHCCAQGIITCIKLKKANPKGYLFAEKIADWAISNMQEPIGYFYYQKTKFYTNKIPYIRWSQAWMFYALAIYLSQTPNSTSKKELYDKN